MITASFLFFILVIFISFYIPGFLLLKLFKLKLTRIEEFVISWHLGISLFIIATYLLSLISASHLYFYFLLILNLVLLKIRKRIKISSFNILKKINWQIALIILIGSIAFSYSMFFSGLITDQGLQYVGVNGNDGVRHVAYIKIMKFAFPPQHPSLSGVDLKGFHYFYDFLISKISLFYGFSVENLNFRFFPFFISILYGLSFFLFSSVFTKNNLKKILILFFAYFSHSFSLLFYLFNNQVDISYSSAVQPIGLIINPFIVFSIAILTICLYLIPKIKDSWKYGIIIAIILGILSQIKVYAGIIGIVSLILYSVYLILRFKKKYLFPIILVLSLSAFLTAITFFPNNYKQGGLVWASLLFYRQFMTSNFLDFLNWETKKTIYLEHNNYIRLGLSYLQAIAIYWILALGLRSIIFLKVKNVFTKIFWLKDYNFLLFSACFTAAVIPSFFIQSVSVFDTVQFFWILLPLLSIPAGIIYHQFLNRGGYIAIISIILLLILTIPGNVDFFIKYIPRKSSIILSKNDLTFLNKVSKNTPTDKYIIFIPSKQNINEKFFRVGSPLLSSVTGRQFYLENGGLPGKLANIYKNRINELKNLDNSIKMCRFDDLEKNINKIKSKYILTVNKYPCLATSSAVLLFKSSDNFNFFILK
jgi:hypothetical protein